MVAPLGLHVQGMEVGRVGSCDQGPNDRAGGVGFGGGIRRTSHSLAELYLASGPKFTMAEPQRGVCWELFKLKVSRPCRRYNYGPFIRIYIKVFVISAGYRRQERLSVSLWRLTPVPGHAVLSPYTFNVYGQVVTCLQEATVDIDVWLTQVQTFHRGRTFIGYTGIALRVGATLGWCWGGGAIVFDVIDIETD